MKVPSIAQRGGAGGRVFDAGIGSALWGVMAGAIALFVQQYRQRAA